MIRWSKRKKKKGQPRSGRPLILGNSDRSKWRWRLEGKKTKAPGYPSVMKFFLKKPGPDGEVLDAVRRAQLCTKQATTMG
jgi:hypothetical protein